MAARDHGRAAAYAAKHRIPRVADSYEAIIADPAIDAVYIPLPNSLHAEWTLAALDAGKHVLCEKPFTANADEAAQVADAAARAAAGSGLVVLEAFHYRYHPLAHRMLRDRRIRRAGAPPSHRDLAVRPDRQQVRHQVPVRSGRRRHDGHGFLRGPHGPDARPGGTVGHLGHGQAPRAEVDRAMSAELQFPSGPTASVHCSMWSSSFLHLAARAVGDERRNPGVQPDRAAVHELADRPLRRHPAASRSRPDGRPTHTNWTPSVMQSLRGQPALTTPQEAVANMAIIDAVYRAANMRPRGA